MIVAVTMVTGNVIYLYNFSTTKFFIDTAVMTMYLVLVNFHHSDSENFEKRIDVNVTTYKRMVIL